MKTASALVGPHEFDPLGKLRPSARRTCRACYEPEAHHPVKGWVKARPINDRTTVGLKR